ncbi:hypothetical protein ACWGOE_03100 [Leucobacter chromiiresistens]
MSRILLNFAAMPVHWLSSASHAASARAIADQWHHRLRGPQKTLPITEKHQRLKDRLTAIHEVRRGVFLWVAFLFIGMVAALALDALAQTSLTQLLADAVTVSVLVSAGLAAVTGFKRSILESQLRRFERRDEAWQMKYTPSKFANPHDLDFVLALPLVVFGCMLIWVGGAAS